MLQPKSKQLCLICQNNKRKFFATENIEVCIQAYFVLKQQVNERHQNKNKVNQKQQKRPLTCVVIVFC